MFWKKPKSKSIALFTDIRLYSEALELASLQEYVTYQTLVDELPHRVKGLLLVKSQSISGMKALIRELRNFGWLQGMKHTSSSIDTARHKLTKKGRNAYMLYKKDKTLFDRHLTCEMHDLYTIPGWFVDRLWLINPRGQGEVIIPAPIQTWRPTSRKWEEKQWDGKLQEQSNLTYDLIQKLCPGAFPVNNEDWLNAVETSWNRLSNLKRRKVAKTSEDEPGSEKRKMKTFAPRRRLTMAMQEAAVSFLFSNKFLGSDTKDFSTNKDPLKPRTYMAWCPRLESLGLIFYTDSHPNAPGRILFPTSVFREETNSDRFEKLEIVNPKKQILHLHAPKWPNLKKNFTQLLIAEHQKTFSRVGSLYVPLLDVRDEVCRQLRLSASTFDIFLAEAIKESLTSKSNVSISLETDIREDQRAAHRLIRRPVVFNGTPHSLIAITQPRSVKEE